MNSLEYLSEKSVGTDHLLVFIHGFIGGNKTFVNSSDEHLSSFFQPPINQRCCFANFHYGSHFLDLKTPRYFLSKIPLVNRFINTACSRPLGSCSSLLVTHYETLKDQYEGIHFIGHSMGGLIGKSAVIQIIKKHNCFNGSLITIATPHRGVELASLSHFLPKSIHLKSLTPLSDEIEKLDSQWEDIGKDIKTKFYCGHSDDIVPDKSTTPRGTNSTPVEVDGCHSSIVKPSNTNSLIVNHLGKTLASFLDISEIKHNRLKAKSSNPLFTSYSPNDEAFYQQRNVDSDFTAKIETTNVWVVGASGTGKTTLALRNTISSSYELHYVDLSPNAILSSEIILNDILQTLRMKNDRKNMNKPLPVNNGEKIKVICEILNNSFSDKPPCILSYSRFDRHEPSFT